VFEPNFGSERLNYLQFVGFSKRELKDCFNSGPTLLANSEKTDMIPDSCGWVEEDA
jgi:arginine/ornithine N-succinyltransferase beta subunit